MMRNDWGQEICQKTLKKKSKDKEDIKELSGGCLSNNA